MQGMNGLDEDHALQEEAGLGPRDLVDALARHWRLIVACSLAGLTAATGFFLLTPPAFETQSKLLVRYLLERGGVDPEMKSQVHGTSYTASVINDEIEILTSWDLAGKVAMEVGPAKVLGKSTREPSETAAARRIKEGLTVEPVRESNVIRVAYRNPDPALAAEVLRRFIESYFAMHLEIHRSVAANQFVAQQTEEVRESLQEIDASLNQLRAEGGILSTTEGVDSLEAQRAASRSELLAAQAERAGQQARVQLLESMLSGRTATAESRHAENAAAGKIPGEDVIATYELLVERLAQLRKRNAELASKFTPDSSLVRASQREIESLEAERRSLVMQFPSLIAKTAKGEPGSAVIDLDGERARLAQIEGKISILESNLAQIEQHQDRLPGILGKIRDLERQREIEEEKYRYFTTSLENARIDGAINPSMMPNISVLQETSPPQKSPGKLLKKVLFMLTAGGLGAGIGLALLLEFVIDRRIKSPQAVERRLGIPVWMTVPFLKGGTEEGREAELAWNPYADAIYGRLLWPCRKRNGHGARLIGCTGLGAKAGASTLARGLAQALQRNGESALLVDLASPCAAASGATEKQDKPVLEIAAKHYQQTQNPASETLAEGAGSLAPARLLQLADQLRSGDHDWVLFDLPPVTDTSPTSLLAGRLDHVLLVADPATAVPELLRRVHEELAERNPNVSCIYNKRGMRVPAFTLAREFRQHRKSPGHCLGQPLRETIPV